MSGAPGSTPERTPARDAKLAAFLRAAGWPRQAARPLAGDASNRRYLRLAETGRGGAVLMDAPPESGEDVRRFVAVTHWLRQHGFSAPAIAAADTARGFLLLEDLGDDLYTLLLAKAPERDAELYGVAVDLLAGLAAIPAPATLGPADGRVALAPYDAAVLAREAALVREWWLPAASGEAPSPELAAEFDGLVADLFGGATALAEPVRDVLVLRDYHADNLIWLPQRKGVARAGLLDYQDALAGHAAYDLMSLLEDARRDTSPELREAMIGRYLGHRPELDAEAFRAAISSLGAQRNLKIVGIFARLAIRDAKRRYLELIPRVWDHLMRDLEHPALAPLARWVARHLAPPEPATLARVAAVARATQ